MSRLLVYFLYFSALWIAVLKGQNPSELEQALSKAGVDAIFPDENGYANASQPLNKRFDGIHPVAIAYPIGTKQVAATVKAGAVQGLPVVARSGGHSYIANSLGGTSGALVVDLSKNRNITVDNSSGIVTFETGLRLGDIALTLNDYGRAMPHGRCSYVGVGGHSGHGGWGHHSRMWGLILDVIESVTVVLADGSIKTASETENPDLFWALRGSSSSFGIVTSIRAKTFPAPPEATIYNYTWTSLSSSVASSAVSSFQSFMGTTDIPSTLGGELLVGKGAREGEVAVRLFGGYWGSHDSFNDTLHPLLSSLPEPDITNPTIGNWLEGLEAWVLLPLNTTADPSLDAPLAYYAKSIITPDSEDELLTPEAIESMVEYIANEGFNAPVDLFEVEIELYGGRNSAINAVPHDATAFVHRAGLFNMQIASYSLQSTFPEAGLSFMDGIADSITKEMPEDWDWGSYVGYPDERLDDWQKRYYKDHYPRLQSLKKEFDPDNVFRFPLSIEV